MPGTRTPGVQVERGCQARGGGAEDSLAAAGGDGTLSKWGGGYGKWTTLLVDCPGWGNIFARFWQNFHDSWRGQIHHPHSIHEKLKFQTIGARTLEFPEKSKK